MKSKYKRRVKRRRDGNRLRVEFGLRWTLLEIHQLEKALFFSTTLLVISNNITKNNSQAIMRAPLKPLNHQSTLISSGLREAFNWSPIMPKDWRQPLGQPLQVLIFFNFFFYKISSSLSPPYKTWRQTWKLSLCFNSSRLFFPSFFFCALFAIQVAIMGCIVSFC